MLPLAAALLLAAPPERPVRAAVYDGPGAYPTRRLAVAALRADPNIHPFDVSPDDVRAGKLADADVVLFPGGVAVEQAKALGADGRKAVRDFVAGGGGYVGVCAGAYLATGAFDWSLRILDARLVDNAHWNRGTGDVDVGFAPAAEKVLGASGVHTMLYWQGPLLAPGRDPEVPDYEVLATFRTEICKPDSGARPGVMAGTAAAACGRFGKGRVLAFSPHPEATERQEWLIARAAKWTAGR